MIPLLQKCVDDIFKDHVHTYIMKVVITKIVKIVDNYDSFTNILRVRHIFCSKDLVEFKSQDSSAY